jgi:hypothetical protein
VLAVRPGRHPACRSRAVRRHPQGTRAQLPARPPGRPRCQRR